MKKPKAMKAPLIVILSLLHLASFAFATTARPVLYKSGNGYAQGMLYIPAGEGPFPAVVVINRWRGLNDWVREQASRLADEGYVALSVDLDSGRVARPPRAPVFLRIFPVESVGGDLSAAVDFLRSQNNVRRDHIGSVEDSVRLADSWFGEGGFLLEATLAVSGRKIAIVNYGRVFSEEEYPSFDLKLPDLFDQKGQGTELHDISQAAAASQKRSKLIALRIFPDAEHVQDPNDRSDYRPQDPHEGWQRMLSFLLANLKSSFGSQS
jgi:carboxymethylenebutenolidase